MESNSIRYIGVMTIYQLFVAILFMGCVSWYIKTHPIVVQTALTLQVIIFRNLKVHQAFTTCYPIYTLFHQVFSFHVAIQPKFCVYFTLPL